MTAFRRDDRGQTLVLLAVALPLLLGLMLLVLDGGRLYVERERIHGAAQLAADAASAKAGEMKSDQRRDLQRVRSEVDPVVRDALERNLQRSCRSDGSQPCRYTLEVVPGAEPDRPGLKIHVALPFTASVQAVRFTLGARGTAGTRFEGASAIAVFTPSPTPSPTPLTTPRPSPIDVTACLVAGDALPLQGALVYRKFTLTTIDPRPGLDLGLRVNDGAASTSMAPVTCATCSYFGKNYAGPAHRVSVDRDPYRETFSLRLTLTGYKDVLLYQVVRRSPLMFGPGVFPTGNQLNSCRTVRFDPL